MMAPRLELQSVSAGYPRRLVLHEVSLTVSAGECLAVIGANGSGKSTLLNVLARQIRPKLGKVLIEGEDAWRQSPQWAAQHIALAHGDEPSEWPMTVEQAVSLGRTPHRGWIAPFTRGDQTVVTRAMERCGLSSLRQRPTTELSDGERQRVSLARALAQEPRILLLDEPTANLDIRYQIELLDLVRGLAQSGLAVVAAIHDLTLAARWSDRMTVLREGTMLKTGTGRDVLTPDTIAAAFGVRTKILADPSYCTPVIVPVEVGR
jgi:iron complex transport system ATP-binding protein